MIKALFVDVSNLFHCVSKKYDGQKLDYQKYLQRAGPDICRAIAYGIMMSDETIKFITCLKHFGYETCYVEPKINPITKQVRRINLELIMAMDVVRLIDRVDGIILGSSDSNLAPLAQWIKEKGVYCSILACGISRELKVNCNEWVELDNSLLEVKI